LELLGTREDAAAAAILAVFLAVSLIGQGYPIAFHGFRATVIGGEISQNTTWGFSESPYVVTSDVVVASGAVLTIDPGVAVRFDGDFSIIAHGTIRAVGTDSGLIVFTSNKPQPAPGDWNTIEFAGAQNESFHLRNVIVEYARNGVTVRSLGSATVENSRIADNMSSGVYVEGFANLIVRDNVIERNANGIASNGEKVSGVRVVGNSINSNENGAYFQASAPQNALIADITVLNNTLEFNRNGLFFYIFAGSAQYLDTSVIRGVLISGNTASFNAEYGIYLYSGGPWLGSIFNTSISNNCVTSNRDGVYLFAKAHSISAPFDVIISNNVVSENSGKGVYVSGGASRPVEQGIKTNLSRNSISYNGYGVFYDGDTDNVAHYNDVYNNSHGMYVSDNASVNAEYSFWGASNGPFHPLLSPDGEGNAVNGNGMNLDFTPFLSAPTANRRPVAVLEADKMRVSVNETVMFNASRSFDDGRIKEYFFDFGDGSNSGWIISSVVAHAYSYVGSFNVSLVIVDDLGFESLASSVLVVQVQLTLFVTLSFNADSVDSKRDLMITVLVTGGVHAVPEADVSLHSKNGGVFSPQTGVTNSSGFFASVFSAPSVEQQVFVMIVVNASKEGYWSGQSQRQVAVLAPRTFIGVYSVLIVLVFAVLVALAVLVVLRKWRSK